ncbi:MAG: diguanylate cyclase [Rhodoferax sp.]|nr:diguanylate cyclase [Rhodoferax sp.]
MTPWLQRLRTWLAEAGAENRSVLDEAIAGNLRRLRWMVPVVIALNLVHVGIFWWGFPPGSPAHNLWKHAIGWTHLVMSGWMAVLGVLAFAQSRQSQRGLLARALHLFAPLSALLFAATIATIDQLVTPNISPFLLGCMFASLLFQLRPTEVLALYAAGYGFFFFAIGATQPDAALLLSNRVNGLTATLLGIFLSTVLWRKNVRYVLLQRELSQRNQELTRQQEELLWLAKRDALTGLFNRGEFLRLAEVELLRSLRHGTDMSAIMVDLDHFKKINDRYGHPAGDAVLKHTAACLLGAVRVTDVVARLGGEEFVVLLPQTRLDAAVQLAEKLLRTLQQSPAPITSGLSISFTASLGVGSLPAGHNSTVAALYAAADHALYEAKRKGRNRVEKTESDGTLTPSDFQRMRRQ